MHTATLSFVGDIGAGLAALAEGAEGRQTWPGGEAAAARTALEQAFAAGPEWGPAKVIDVCRRCLPRDTVATADSGAHRILLSQMWKCYEPRTLLQSTGLCTMGCALPLAAGYKRSDPDRPVVAFTGDAGIEMVLGDLATIRDAAVPIIMVVFVDESLALIELKQRNMAHRNVGVDFAGTDFVKLAEAFSMHGARVDDAVTLAAELTDALARNRSSLLACRISRQAYDGAF
jgi:acetolactate synthase-1/2/3 large subunit